MNKAANADTDRRLTPRAFAALLFGLALLPRLYLIYSWPHKPVWDGKYYDIGARSIATGLGYAGITGKPWCHYPVGYSGVLGLVYRMFGDGPMVAPLFNALVGALLAVVSYRLARHAIGEIPARTAGVLLALSPGMVLYTPVLMTELAAALAIVAAAWVATAGHRRALLFAGLLLGVGTLIRPQSLVLAPALALFCWPHDLPLRQVWKRLLRGAALATVAAMLVVLPWTLRNCRVMDGCALVSTNAGWNLAIGSFPRATGRFETLRSGDGCHIVTGQVQQNRCWLGLGARWIAADPKRWLGLVPVKLGHTFDHESFAVGYLAEAAPERWPAPRQRRWRGILSWSHRALLSLGLIGVLPAATRRRPLTLLPLLLGLLLIWWAALTPGHPFWPLALVTIVAGGWLSLKNAWGHSEMAPEATANAPAGSRAVIGFSVLLLLSLVVIHAIFFGEDRYHLVATPLWCILAARALWPTRRLPAVLDDAGGPSTSLP